MNEWLKSHLVCPRDKEKLELRDEKLFCPQNHVYPVIQDIPIMLVDDAAATHEYLTRTLEQVSGLQSENPSPMNDYGQINELDGFVQGEIPYTSGTLYYSVHKKLTRYPIPVLRLEQGNGEILLDIGCNWGRWSIAAARKGYKPIGIDPSLDAILAAKRVSKHLGAETNFVVGDARFLPFAADSFEVVFSYGVFQHFSKDNVRTSLDEVVRVLIKNGKALFQMPNKYGVRSFYNQWRRGFTEGEDFDVRYWTPSELMKTFEERFGETRMSSDCFFGLGLQKSDADLFPMPYKIAIHSSEILRKISKTISPITKIADSVYLECSNRKK